MLQEGHPDGDGRAPADLLVSIVEKQVHDLLGPRGAYTHNNRNTLIVFNYT